MRPDAADSTYPSTPDIWPANSRSGRSRVCQVSCSTVGSVDVGIAVDHAEAHELRLFEARNQPQHAGLIAPFDLRLESHQAEVIAGQRVLPQLHDGVRRPSGLRILQATGFIGRTATCRGRAGP
jgi:hypothetical protein